MAMPNPIRRLTPMPRAHLSSHRQSSRSEPAQGKMGIQQVQLPRHADHLPRFPLPWTDAQSVKWRQADSPLHCLPVSLYPLPIGRFPPLSPYPDRLEYQPIVPRFQIILRKNLLPYCRPNPALKTFLARRAKSIPCQPEQRMKWPKFSYRRQNLLIQMHRLPPANPQNNPEAFSRFFSSL